MKAVCSNILIILIQNPLDGFTYWMNNRGCSQLEVNYTLFEAWGSWSMNRQHFFNYCRLIEAYLHIFSEHSKFQTLPSFQFPPWYWEAFAYSSVMQQVVLGVWNNCLIFANIWTSPTITYFSCFYFSLLFRCVLILWVWMLQGMSSVFTRMTLFLLCLILLFVKMSLRQCW